MKKLSLLALPLALLAFGSCDNNEIQDNTLKEMNVMPANVSKTTRGYSEGTEFYETLTSQLHAGSKELKAREMRLSAYLYPQEGEEENYFVGNTFAKDASAEIWRNYNAGAEEFEPVYWPIGGEMDFLAYSLSEPRSVVVEWNKENAASQVTLTVPAENTQNDILYSSLSHERQTKTSGTVNMTFKHAQAWLEFVVKGGAYDYPYRHEDDLAPEEAIKFIKIELEDVYNAGVLNISNNRGDALAEWDFSGVEQRDVTVDNNYGVKYVTPTAQYLDMLIPEQQKQDFILYYQLGEQEQVLKYRFSTDRDSWLMGNKYVYTIDITTNEVTVYPTVEEWNLNGWTTLNHSLGVKTPAGSNPSDFAVLINGHEELPAEPILFNLNDSLTVEAVCGPDAQFYRWSDDTEETPHRENPRRIAVKDLEEDIVAVFLPIEAIPHAFTVNASGDEVFFAKGNLYADKSSGETVFGIESEQYYFRTRKGVAGEKANLAGGVTGTPANTSGLFQWNVGAKKNFGAFGAETALSGSTSDVMDWGPAYGPAWETLSKDEWQYIIDNNTTKKGVTVCGIPGVVLASDGFDGTIAGSYEAPAWKAAEKEGLVFLPGAGYFDYNNGGSVERTLSDPRGAQGLYWASTAAESDGSKACRLLCDHSNLRVGSPRARSYGMSVRLVCEE